MTKNNENEQTNNTNPADWREKLNDLMQVAQSEIKKTTQIGLKMLSASQSNEQLHDIYEMLGKWLIAEVQSGKLQIDDVEVEGLIAKVRDLEKELEGYEQDVQDIKKG